MKSTPVRSRGWSIGRATPPLSGALAGVLSGASPAAAHAFGARYDLPLPLGLYLIGAGAAVALSFVIMAYVFRAGRDGGGEPWVDLFEFGAMRALARPAVRTGVRAVSVALLVLVVAAGLMGTPEPAKNFAPTFVWILWWVGLAYVAALVANPWPVINPWAIVFAWFERLAPRAKPGLAYPAWLGVWPAVALFWLFAWFELISEAAKSPATLAIAALVYSAITWLGMAAFGRTAWLARGEAFAVAFEVFGRFAPIGGRKGPFPDDRPRQWRIRPYAGALVVTDPCRLSATAFIVLMLSTVTFDGFKETPLWGALLQSIARAPLFHPIIQGLHDLGLDFNAALETAMLALFPIVFLTVFLGFSWLMKRSSGDARPVTEIAGLFVFSLVPIAIAYHLAHYLSYLMVAGQFIIPLASDPFGFGWDLFGTAGYQVDIGVIGAKFVWYTAVIAIVLGHVISVGVAHLVALGAFATPAAALRSQYPMLILMVAYTMVSLWILSQPIVGSPGLGELRSSRGTMSLAPFEFRERCLDLSRGDRIRYTFRADRPVRFDIHYHDGFSIRYAVERTIDTILPTGFSAGTGRRYCLMWFNEGLTRASVTYRVDGP